MKRLQHVKTFMMIFWVLKMDNITDLRLCIDKLKTRRDRAEELGFLNKVVELDEIINNKENQLMCLVMALKRKGMNR